MKINKRFLQFYAAALILIFHLWYPVTNSEVENFIIKTGYIGVDIFFFLSAFSLADKKIKYLEFIKNRFTTVYVKFLIFVIVAAVVKGYSVLKTLKILTMVDFFERGGGSFLWFVPAIMMFYLLYPLFVNWNFKYKSIVVIVAWFAVSMLLGNVLGYTKIFIFTNRIPVMVAGYELKTRKLPDKRWIYLAILAAGVALLYFFGYKKKLDIPFKDFYFVAGLIFTVGICGLSSLVREWKCWGVLSIGTLELYALQMIFGSKLVFAVKNLVGNVIMTNCIVLVVLLAISYVLALVYNKIVKLIN